MSFLPGLGIAKGHGADPHRALFEPKATIMYPEATPRASRSAPRLPPAALRRVGHARVRDVLPVRAGVSDRVHRTWGGDGRRAASTSTGAQPRRPARALARQNRPCGAPAGRRRTRRTSTSARSICADDGSSHRFRPQEMLQILQGPQDAYGYLPIAGAKRISFSTGSRVTCYGTASYYRHLRFDPPRSDQSPCAVRAA